MEFYKILYTSIFLNIKYSISIFLNHQMRFIFMMHINVMGDNIHE